MKRITLNLFSSKETAPIRFALVDDRDFELVSRLHWHAVKKRNVWYAKSNHKTEAGWRGVAMHSLIMGFPKGGLLVDHRNRNGLDNRRRNLRLATRSQNAANSIGHRDSKSAHKGVHFEKFSGRWRAELRANGKVVLKTRFDSELEAARAYRAAIRLHYGRFARCGWATKEQP